MSQSVETIQATPNRILVIEDELPLLEVISSYLQRELKCEVHRAADREEAEALLDVYKYSLVITDLSLTPHIHGQNEIARTWCGRGVVSSCTLGANIDSTAAY